jgi:putative transposase
MPRIQISFLVAHSRLVSRTVNGEFLFGATEKEAFRRMMWRISIFFGVEVLTYVVMDYFKSILVDGEQALATMAAYIDLNPLRAGIVEDPLEYEWSGYDEACVGSRRAKRGICKALKHPQDLWEKKTLPRYRMFLFDEGLEVEGNPEKAKRRSGVMERARLKVQAEGGVLSGRVVLRKRISSLTNGVVYGREKFVREVAES